MQKLESKLVYSEVFLVINHFLDIFTHQITSLIHNLLSLCDLVRLFLTSAHICSGIVPVNYTLHCLSAVIQIWHAFNICLLGIDFSSYIFQ